MTNRERAEEISIHAKGSGNCEAITGLIERALDEKDEHWGHVIIDAISDIPLKLIQAEKRGYDKWLTKEVGNTLQIHGAWDMYVKGLRVMRERAAKAAETTEGSFDIDVNCSCGQSQSKHVTLILSGSGKSVRALPIEG